MNEKELADRFSHDLDGLLDRNELLEIDPTPTEYKETLELAQTLSKINFSNASRTRNSLRAQLLRKTRKENTILTVFKRSSRSGMAFIFLGSILISLLFGTGAVKAVTQSITDFVQRLWVGDFTWIQQTDPSQMEHPQFLPSQTVTVETRGDLWIIHTPIGNFAGDALPGREPTVQRFDSISEAQTVATIDIRQPSYIPASYELWEAMVTPMDWVFLFYDSPNGDLLLAQAPVGEASSSDNNRMTAVGIGILTDQEIESVTLKGLPAGWVEGYGLIWEADGISFTVGGAHLSRDEIMQIAESLE